MKNKKSKIVTYPDPVLTKKAKKVESAEEEKELIEKMKEILKEEDGAGLAAPQIGISKQIFVIREQNAEHGHDHFYAFMNPEILEKSEEKIIVNEGCLSFPNLWIDVDRHKKVKIKLLNEGDEKIIIEAEDMGAVVFQHEIDHLFGTVFIERLSFFKRLLAKARYYLKNIGS